MQGHGVGQERVVELHSVAIDARLAPIARMRDQLVSPPAGSSPADRPFSAGIVTYPHPAVTQADDMFALVEAALARGKAQVGEQVGVAD